MRADFGLGETPPSERLDHFRHRCSGRSHVDPNHTSFTYAAPAYRRCIHRFNKPITCDTM